MNTPECCDKPRGFVGGTCDYCGGTVQPYYNEEGQTLRLMHRLASKDPRVVEYFFSDRPDEVFTDRDLLQKHRGLTEAQLRLTVTVSPI